MDQDDSMLSTPSSTNQEDDTFDHDQTFRGDGAYAPNSINSANVYVHAQTPRNDHLNAAAPGELSPPRSANHVMTIGSGNRTATGTGAGAGAPANGFGSSRDFTEDDEAIDMLHSDSGGLNTADVQGESPSQAGPLDEAARQGATWKSKKALEEAQRSWDHIVDKDFQKSIAEFGDVVMKRQ